MLYLASKSPRRAEILQQIGVNFEIVTVDVAEIPHEGESPHDYVLRLARSKAEAGFAVNKTFPTLGSDTIVHFDGQILEKPKSFEEFSQVMHQLSGATHQVLTAVSVVSSDEIQTALSVSNVTFRILTDELISRYWQSGEPHDKAGGYGIQGLGAVFVEKIEGSYSGIVGLPIETLTPLLEYFKISYWSASLS